MKKNINHFKSKAFTTKVSLNKNKLYFLILLLMINFISLYGVITEDELQIYNKMLSDVKLDTSAVNFPKDWSGAEFKIPKVIEALEKPFTFPKFVDSLKTQFLKENHIAFFSYMSDIVYQTEKTDISEYLNSFSSKLNTAKHPIDILQYAKFVMEKTLPYYDSAFDSLSISEIHELEQSIYYLGKGDSIDDDKYNEFFNRKSYANNDYEIEYYIELIKKIDFKMLMLASEIYFKGMDILANSDISHINFNKIHQLNTQFGRLISGTYSNDTYLDKCFFIYEPEGNDIYSTDISTNYKYPFFTIIDNNGDDTYRNSNIGELFNIMFGIGYHVDKQGNDLYYGDDYTFSSNFGSLISIDLQGNDQYISGSRSLGSSLFGISLLINKGGNDWYSSTQESQGFAGPLACGVLADYGSEIVSDNSDNYFSGGRYLHSPLAPEDFRSMSQGFGYGIRPDMAGGIGIIFEQNGNDNYNAGAYAQGVAYWLALGIVIDLSGNDFYNAIYYPQGSGIHLAGGFLYDEKGDDHYYSKFGPGQGAGHDYGVGFLIDRSGNDAYSVDGGNGLGLTNSVGVFLDVQGNDRYERKRKDSYGYANIARYSGGLGLFLDTSGNDSYANETMNDNANWINGFYGLGLDTLAISEKKIDLIEDTYTQDPLVDSLSTIDVIFSAASEWEVGSAKNRVRNARETLITRENEAFDYIFKEKLKTKQGLELRAIVELFKNSSQAKEKLSLGLKHKHFRAVSNTIYIIGELQDTTFIDTFENMLNENKNINSILSALGNMKTSKSIDLLEQYINSDNPYTKVITARSLKSINTTRSIDILNTLKNDNCFLIQSMIRKK